MTSYSSIFSTLLHSPPLSRLENTPLALGFLLNLVRKPQRISPHLSEVGKQVDFICRCCLVRIRTLLSCTFFQIRDEACSLDTWKRGFPRLELQDNTHFENVVLRQSSAIFTSFCSSS
ncbi:hypothetical protein KC19_4G017100 [Ceratodon purpureus]|uniref:Uncharacterized protein n=1 Tax=Ceratodon purpureus TaxID=3225 RepID=A0A8T0I4E4_CERPU|nr:hypothetical protein KC19_4G017100 [Ceratodon purpureus]